MESPRVRAALASFQALESSCTNNDTYSCIYVFIYFPIDMMSPIVSSLLILSVSSVFHSFRQLKDAGRRCTDAR